MIPSAADRAPKDGQAPVQIGSGGATNVGSGPSANAIGSFDAVNEQGGRMAHANQQVPDGMEPKQVKDDDKVTDAPVAQQ
ncbi:hypothetical protein JCM6882_005155 [Rhodosporidiobolus microsporus]